MCRETSGLPPTWIDVGTRDLFHDEDIAYAERLKEAGVQCTRSASMRCLTPSERGQGLGNPSCYLAAYDTDPSTGPTTTVLTDDKLLEVQADTLYIYLACALAEAADLSS